MSNKTNPAGFSRARSVIATFVAIALLAAYAIDHRAELGEIFDELRRALPLDSQEQMTESEQWLKTGPTRIDPQELAGLGIEVWDRVDDGYEPEAFGDGWATLEGDCDTRDQILDRDLIDVTSDSRSGCDVADGTLSDPYTGTAIDG